MADGSLSHGLPNCSKAPLDLKFAVPAVPHSVCIGLRHPVTLVAQSVCDMRVVVVGADRDAFVVGDDDGRVVREPHKAAAGSSCLPITTMICGRRCGEVA